MTYVCILGANILHVYMWNTIVNILRVYILRVYTQRVQGSDDTSRPDS